MPKGPQARSARLTRSAIGYNLPRTNSAVRMSPAMAAHLTQRLWDIGDIVNLIAEWETQA